MAKALQITIRESKTSLINLLSKQKNNVNRKKIDLLLVILKYPQGLNTTELSHKVGISHNTTSKWCRQYEEGGIDKLLGDNRKGGNRPTVIEAPIRSAIDEMVQNTKGNRKRYTELQRWIAANFGKQLPYNTLRNYLIRRFKSSSARRVQKLKTENDMPNTIIIRQPVAVSA
jgi:transposase